MTDHGQPAEGLHHYVKILRRHRWFILGSMVIIPAVVLAVSLLQPTRYSATARVIAQSQSPSVSVAVGTNLGLSDPDERELQTLASFVVTREIAERVAEEINWSGQATTLMEDVTAEADPAANVINVTAVQPSPDEAAAVANAFANQFLLWYQESLQKSLDEAIDQITEQVRLARPGSTEHATLVERRGQLEVLKPLVSGGLRMGEAAQPPSRPPAPSQCATQPSPWRPASCSASASHFCATPSTSGSTARRRSPSTPACPSSPKSPSSAATNTTRPRWSCWTNRAAHTPKPTASCAPTSTSSTSTAT